jgi:protein-S-isoprenylcysteine O-methyltransferase Ste14
MDIEYHMHTAFLVTLMVVMGTRLYFHGLAYGASGTRESTRDEGAFKIVRFVVGLPMAFAYMAYIVWPPWLAWSQFAMAPEWRWTGVVLGALSAALTLWQHVHLSRNFTTTVDIRPGGHVVKTGPYRFVRHPMYVAFFLLGFAILFMTANWFMGGGFLLTVLFVVVFRTPIEERKLEEAYGEEYRAYKNKTGALFPKL